MNTNTFHSSKHERIGAISSSWLLVWLGIGVYLLTPGASQRFATRQTPERALASAAGAAARPDAGLTYGVATRSIEHVRVGDRVFARNPEIGDEQRAEWGEPDWETWLRGRFQMPKPNGGVLEIDMIRPSEWFDLHQVVPSESVMLDLPEMGAQGMARVVSISDCPVIARGTGQVVTATFAHPPSTDVIDVLIEDEPQSIGVTDNHLFWSVSSQQFRPIREMSVGESVLNYRGNPKRLVQKTPRASPQLVYNLEVYEEHVYFVGTTGVLVHNAYTGVSENLGNGIERRTYSITSSRTGNQYYRKVLFDTTTGKADFLPFAYRGSNGSPLIQTFKYTGSRLDDFRVANRLSGFGKGAYSNPKGFTWHHLDYDKATGLGRMILVKSDVHAAVGHSGGVADYVAATGKAYIK